MGRESIGETWSRGLLPNIAGSGGSALLPRGAQPANCQCYEMHALELKLPPVVVALLCGGLSWVMAGAGAGPALPIGSEVRTIVSLLIAVAGIVIAAAGVIEFLRAKTTVNPHQPKHASALVTTGILRYSRNPMYLGLLFLLAAWAVYLGSLLALAPMVLFVLYMDRFQIEPEERALSVRFGDAYAAYRSRVRRWV